MSLQSDFGKTGEALACTFLSEQGYKVLEKNWRYRQAEIDIIAENETFIIFAEVKTRSTSTFGKPEIFVTKTKQRHILRAANAYLIEKNIEKEARFDIISILFPRGGTPQIDHIPEAFSSVI